MTTCRRCDRPLGIWWLGTQPYCSGRDLIACLNRAVVQPEPPVVWVNPYDLPPEDIAVCHVCAGSGSVFTSLYPDFETGARPQSSCPWCLGTGVEPGYEVAA